MNINCITGQPELSGIHFTLEELKEINREMETIMRLTDSIILSHMKKRKSDSKIILLRPDITLP